ncbi:MAG: DinB family protein [Bacteroidetes bacterium]|nr:DinB family protein [Bacteroidota bacterium]
MDDILTDFRHIIDRAGEHLTAISEEQSMTPPADGAWSAKEVLGHLIDSAANNHQRFVQAQLHDDLLFRPYDQDRWVEVQRYRDEPWGFLVQLWGLYNLHLLHVIEGMDEDRLKEPRYEHNLDQLAWKPISRSQAATLEYVVRDYVGHLEHHLAQIIPIRTGR